MNVEEFKLGLEELGIVAEVCGDRVTFGYTPDLGKFAGQQLRLGIKVPPNFQLNPPTGIHVSPRILPIHPGNDKPHPFGGVHESAEFEENPAEPIWQYWSRPFTNFAKTDRSVRAYMRHVRALFAGLK